MVMADDENSDFVANAAEQEVIRQLLLVSHASCLTVSETRAQP
jgi:hypothetical protein